MNNLSEVPEYPRNSSDQVSFRKVARSLRSPAKPAPAEAGNEIWFLTLSDLLLLLMIFFVLLLGITLQQQSNSAAPPVQRNNQALPVVATEQPVNRPASPNQSPGDEATSLESDLLGIIDGNEGLEGITVARRSQHVVLTLPEQIIFDSGQADLKNGVLPKLEQIAVFIQKHPNIAVEIQGHTDNRPIANRRYPSNWELSADRATQVAKSLVRLGVNPAIISTRGFGEYKPLYPNGTDSDRMKNRRVELQFSLVSS
ncbi:MAG: flagellar motor protein MotB [Smithellaceae bacterium]